MTIEFADTSDRSVQVLAMIASIAINRLGGTLAFTQQEWTDLNDLLAQQGGLTIVFDDGLYTARIGTLGSIVQEGMEQVQ
jgi:hypothetical protein